MTRDDVPVGKGQCDIRLQIDGEAEVSVRGDMVYIRTISGRDGYDDGNSECNEPLPARDLQGFNFEVKESRNEIRLLAEPSRRNNFAAIVRIRDTSGGQGRYHFRLSWQLTGGGGSSGERRGFGGPPDERRGGPGFSWNNTIDFRGQGRGTSTHSTYGVQRLSEVTINIDRGGRMVATFRADRGRPLSFTGSVMGSEEGRLKADVVSDDGRLHGPMFISVDERRNVNSITLEATDGRDRLRLTWDRR
jgi:hypothetical protein